MSAEGESVQANTSVGLIDTNIVILRRWLDPSELPELMSISSVTLAELSAGIHLVDAADPDAAAERARRTAILQVVESEFDPLPFDAAAARMFGVFTGAVAGTRRSHRRRTADLMIAAVAATNGVPLFTTDSHDYRGLDEFVDVRPVRRPTRPG